MGEWSSNLSKQRANFAQDGERQSIMGARFRHWIKNKKVRIVRQKVAMTVLICFIQWQKEALWNSQFTIEKVKKKTNSMLHINGAYFLWDEERIYSKICW